MSAYQPTNESVSDERTEAVGASFEVPKQSPPAGCEVFSTDDLSDPVRDGGIPPLHVSTYEGAASLRGEFLSGARALGLDTARKPLHPQQFVIADVVNACQDNGRPLWSVLAVDIPRRAAKTTSLLAVALGRCLEREDYWVAYSAQTGIKARDRFLRDIVAPLERQWPDASTAPFKINRSAGSPHVTFKNGSQLNILPPIPASFRGDAYDLVILDEAQEHEPEHSAELLGAIMPTFDTRPDAQLIVAGTTGEHRSGLFWDTLELGRDGKAGIVEYAADPDTPWWEEGDAIAGTIADPEVWKTAHPGIDTLTNLDAITRNFNTLTRAAFAREYLGLWPQGATGGFLNAGKWASSALPETSPEPPDKFVIALAVHPDQTSASIVAAWRDDAGRGHGALLAHRSGTRWVAQELAELVRKYGATVVYDASLTASVVEIEKLKQAGIKRLRVEARIWHQYATACALIYRELGDNNLRHYDQPLMNEAVAVAVKRNGADAKRWAFGRGSNYENDITPLEAFALALHAFDDLKPRAALKPPTAA